VSRYRIALIALAVVVAASAATAAAVHLHAQTTGVIDGRLKPAPALPTEVMVPPRVTLTSLHGKPAVINFWASWCGPCQEEAASLELFAHSLHGRVALVGVDWNDGLDSARRFLAAHRWTFPVLRDPEGLVGDDYGVRGLPATFVLDADSRIVTILLGPQTVADIEAALRRAGLAR
jgi:thiol-disulfide isomerase/thioredoxin